MYLNHLLHLPHYPHKKRETTHLQQCADNALRSSCYPFQQPSAIFLGVESARGKEVKANNSHIIVMGLVYCDICFNNTFSPHSYFLSGAEVKIDCIFKAVAPRTAEHISFSVNRTTNRYGVYKLEIPSVEGIKCAEDSAIVSSCQASLMWSSTPECNIPGYKSTSDEIAIKSKQANLCIYSLNALNFRPTRRQIALCGKKKT